MSQNYEYFGKYILLEKLASGGMAEVWLARAPGAGGIGKFVAIKKILPQYSDNPEFIQMFRDEAAIAMNLSHSNIVSIYEFGQERNQLFLVLDYVEGRNLRQILNKMKPTSQRFSIDQVIYMIKDVAIGLDHAHRSLNSATGKPLNITHRDMSPQNIMISFEGEVKIIDFGIAKAENQMENTKTGTLKGKFGYMSPEQAEGMSTDLRTDIFSLGIVMWELLANDRLFIANNEINTLRKIRECQVPSLTKINPNIHPELERITMKALTRDRNLRYQTAAAVHRDLNRFLNRQYPDFSPHDFAVYIKTLYADDILETRKRVIEYSKIPFQNQIGKQKFEEDKTVVTSFPQTSENEDQKTRSTIRTANTSTNGRMYARLVQTGDTNGKKDGHTVTVTETETFNDEAVQSSEPREVNPASDASIGATGDATVDPSTDSGSINIKDLSSSQFEESDSVLDFSALEKGIETPLPVQPKRPFNPESSNKKGSADVEIERVESRKPVAIKKMRRSSKARPKSGAMTFLFSVAAGIIVYVLATSFFPQQTDTLERAFRKLIVAKFIPPEPKVAPAQQTPPEGNDTQASEQPPDEVFPELRGIIIQSIPSGAEIFIDGEPTGESTPSRINIPTTKGFTLMLKKARYVDFIKPNLWSKNMEQASFTATLQKALVAYIDVDVRPSRNVKLYINGQQIKGDIPVSHYAIPAGQPISVRAVSLVTGAESEQTVKLYEDQRKTLLLDLNKNRTPSNSD